LRPVKYNNGEAKAIGNNVSEATTVLHCVQNLKAKTLMGPVWNPIYSNGREVKCGYRPKNDIIIARRCVNGYSITAATAKSVTDM
jgi:hypothetical protein